MPSQISRLILTAFLTGAVAIMTSPAMSQQAPGGAPPPPPVAGVMTLKKAMLPTTRLLPGRAEAFQTADIRPRVSGIIQAIPFREGSPVKSGDVLYQINDESYAAAVAQAEAAVAKAQASVPSAEANLARYERLVGSGATQIEFEAAKVTLLQANADVASAKAALTSAQIDLDLTTIRAPFDGIADETAFNVGNVVTANQADALTTVRQLDPIYIKLTESSTYLLKLRSAIESGQLKGVNGAIPIRLTLDNGTEYDQRGTLDMSQMTVSETTGTFSIRVVFPNPDQIVLPGMYVRAVVAVGDEEGYAIPQLATSRNSDGSLSALFVTADGKSEARTFRNAVASNNSWLVTEGVADGDRVIISGLQSIPPGIAVTPVEMKIDEKGVVVPAEPVPAAPAAATPAP